MVVFPALHYLDNLLIDIASQINWFLFGNQVNHLPRRCGLIVSLCETNVHLTFLSVDKVPKAVKAPVTSEIELFSRLGARLGRAKSGAIAPLTDLLCRVHLSHEGRLFLLCMDP